MRKSKKGLNRCGFRHVSILVVCFLLLSLVMGTGTAEGNILRIGGSDRYETSALVAGDGFDYANTVIIARGDQGGQFADGLASSVLSGILNAPVLLTEPGTLPDSIIKAITDLGATRAIVLGGTEAISGAVVDGLQDLGLVVDRIGGKDRYETAAKIAREAKKRGSLGNYALLVNGFATADSLVAAPAAFRNHVPILLVTRDTIPEATENALKDLGISQVYIVGGTAVVGNTVENRLSAITFLRRRLGGADRYATSVALAKELFAGEANLVLTGGLDANLVDSIGACVFGQPVLYVRNNLIPGVINDYLQSAISGAGSVKIIGGPEAVSEGVKREVRNIFDSAGAGSSSSGSSGSSGKKTKVGTISVTGEVEVGATLTAGADGQPNLKATYKWYRSDRENEGFTAIPFATAKTYTLTKADAGKYIKVEVKGTGSYTGTNSKVVGPVLFIKKVTTAREFRNAIKNNDVDIIILDDNISGNVTATRRGTKDFSIDFGSYTLTGNLEITANRVAKIVLNGTGDPSIIGNLTVAAELATIENYITVSGDVIVAGIGGDSWIEYADDNTIIITTNSGGTIVIEGNPQGITVEENAGGGINITANSPVTITVENGAEVDNIIVAGTASGTSIINNGNVSNVTADGDVEIVNNNTENAINVGGTGNVLVSGEGAGQVTGDKVKIAVSAISVDIEALVLALYGEDFAETGKITATISPTNASNKEVTWESSDEDVATVDENGNVTAVAVGETTITATSVGNKNKKATCEVTVGEGEEATWEATDGVGTHTIDDTAYIFQEYKLLDGEGEKISLHQDNVASITSNGRELTPNTDSTLWINVRLASGERVYVVKTNDDDIYVAKLDWEGPQALEIEKQGDDLIKCGDDVYRYHYKINLAMKKDDTLVYRIKPTGEIDKQTINEDKDDFSIYFRPTDGVFTQLEGDHTYVIKKDGVWHEGAITYQDKSKYGFTLDDDIEVVVVADLISGHAIKATGAEPGNPGDVPEEALEALAEALDNGYNVDGLASRLVKVTLKATEIKDTGYEKVRILPLTVKKNNSDASDKLQAWMYAAAEDKTWFNTVVTGWGTQGTGFKLDPDENSEMDVYIFASEPGDYEITFKAVDTSRGEDDTKKEAVIATGTTTVTVESNVSPLEQSFYAAGDTLSFTISGLNPNEEVEVSMMIYLEGGGPAWDTEPAELENMRREKDSGKTAWFGTADEYGKLTVSGTIAEDLPYGVLHIILPQYGGSINNSIQLYANSGDVVRVGSPIP